MHDESKCKECIANLNWKSQMDSKKHNMWQEPVVIRKKTWTAITELFKPQIGFVWNIKPIMTHSVKWRHVYVRVTSWSNPSSHSKFWKQTKQNKTLSLRQAEWKCNNFETNQHFPFLNSSILWKTAHPEFYLLLKNVTDLGDQKCLILNLSRFPSWIKTDNCSFVL